MTSSNKYINLDGELMHEGDYSSIDGFVEDRAVVVTTNGLTHITFDFLCPYPKYKWLSNYSYGWAIFQDFNGIGGFVNQSHDKYIHLDYEQVTQFSGEGLATFSQKGLYGIVKSNGEIIGLPQFSRIDGFSEGVAAVEINSKLGYINTEGIICIPPEWTMAMFFSEGLASVANEDYQWGCIDHKGHVVIPANYSFLGTHKEGRICFKKGRKYGFLNSEGTVVIPALYDEATEFSNGFASVKIKNKWGIINYEGKYLVEPQLDSARSFRNGYSLIRKNGVLSLIDVNGLIQSYPEYVWMSHPYKGVIAVTAK
ncbi:WG repeat-containing protein [Paenibacillus sp. FSL R7-0333]|uniref:WG repeat-containing protein n=1 Tax=Paenibacillus sp. FSL R7-0333 TaxID=1926587 RepID=UPI00096FE6F6|nr:hypothetical protein BK146_05130 [Paenibacillus sp. FSL R7-0333]